MARVTDDSASSPKSRGAADAARERAFIVWIGCGGCDGCTMSVLGAVSPTLEELLAGDLTDIPQIELIHPVLSLESGAGYIQRLEDAARGRLDPFLLVVEGSPYDVRLAGEGCFSGLGERAGQPIAAEEWVKRLAARAEAVIAIGTCATWGGIPAAAGGVTGAMGLGALLGLDFRSGGDLPVVNVPGCAPSGDVFVETLQYVFLHLHGLLPLDLDEMGQPRWLFSTPHPIQGPELDWMARPHPGDTAMCPVPERGWINRVGGCAATGGACNGCTRADFPDRMLPLVEPR
jgi:hydrogenase small subunit